MKQPLSPKLTNEQVAVLRDRATEAPFSGTLLAVDAHGTFSCANCNTPLFASGNKFDSGCGWPSFDDALPGSVKLSDDTTHDMHRVEVTCATCGGHLGHVFDDGPRDTTGKRYCINSLSLDFAPKK
jgi:peptide-methionine (R)-S-oxide reductase